MSRFFLIASDDKIYEVPPDKTLFVGRAPLNHIILKDRTVSRTHAAVAPSPSGPILSDRGSNNGTLLNGRSIKEAALGNSDVIQIGKFVFYVFFGTPEEAQKWVERRAAGGGDSDKTVPVDSLHPLRDSVMTGDLATFDLLNLVQSLADQKKNGALTLKQRNRVMGHIFYMMGNIVGAESAGSALKGKAAFFELMLMKHETFEFHGAAKPPGISIVDPPQVLLQEVRRLAEEKKRG